MSVLCVDRSPTDHGSERPAPHTRSQPHVLVCDDDRGVRSVITDMVEERAGQVIAETDRSIDAIALIERFQPNVVVLDLGLAQGSGKDVIDFVATLDDPPQVIVFTSFDGAAVGASTGAVQVILKPDFELLGVRLDSMTIEARAGDRRKPTRAVPVPGVREASGADRADEFYRTLADAHADDTVMSVSLRGLDAITVIEEVRRTVRAQDRLVTRGDALIVLLVSGAAAAPDALCRRLIGAIPDLDERVSSRGCGDDPVAAFVAVAAAPTGPC